MKTYVLLLATIFYKVIKSNNVFQFLFNINHHANEHSTGKLWSENYLTLKLTATICEMNIQGVSGRKGNILSQSQNQVNQNK